MSEMLYIIMALILVLSIGLNIFLVWYTKNVLRRMIFISDHMTTLVEEVVSFHDHLSAVHELEVFYGDETLGGLIQHSTGLIETLEDFEEIYTLFDEAGEELFEEVKDDDTASETAPSPQE